LNRVRQVDEWIHRNVEDIIEEHGDELFTTADEARQKIQPEDLHEVPLLDEHGHEIPIYTNTGYQIERCLPSHTDDNRPHGVLMDLRNLNKLFDSDEDTYDMVVDGRIDPDSVKYYVYPQAGLVTAGHFQANGLMNNFQKRLNNLNQRILEELTADDVDMDEEVSDGVAITGIGCQGYNVVMHSTRGLGSQHHDAQKGYVTGTLSGAWATEGTMVTIAKEMQRRCIWQLPHKTYDQKVSNPDIDHDF
jgi:hypothetical protein